MAKVRTPPIYTTPQDAALAFYHAFEARDLDAMMATWADDEEIVCVHPGAATRPAMLRPGISAAVPPGPVRRPPASATSGGTPCASPWGCA